MACRPVRFDTGVASPRDACVRYRTNTTDCPVRQSESGTSCNAAAGGAAVRVSTERQRIMNSIKTLALVLIVGGLLGLVYGGFSYTKDTSAVKLGPLELTVKEQKRVNIPLWAGVGALVIGGVLLVTASKR